MDEPPLHNIPSSEVLIKRIGAVCLRPDSLLASPILYSRYYSMYYESMFLVWCFSNTL